MPLRQIAIITVALMLAACGVTRHSIAIAPHGLAHIPLSAVPGGASYVRPSDALRIDFYSRPELLSEEGYILNDVAFCDDASMRVGIAGPVLGNASIRHPVERQRVAAGRANGPDAPARPLYSSYLFVSRPAFPGSDQLPAQPAYDLAREPRAICLSLSLREGYEFERTTNTLRFSAEQVAAALAAR
jgi:hypothetical protein